MTYFIEGLQPAPFAALFGLSDDALAERRAVRMIASKKPSFPCRVLLDDADVGTPLLLVNHVSHDVPNPYRASHAIFITEGADEPAQFVDSVPPALDRRTLSLRGFDRAGMMIDATLAAPGEADGAIRTLFEDARIDYIHAHNAVRGCFAAAVKRDRP
jgi:hypothetical protein